LVDKLIGGCIKGLKSILTVGAAFNVACDRVKPRGIPKTENKLVELLRIGAKSLCHDKFR